MLRAKIQDFIECIRIKPFHRRGVNALESGLQGGCGHCNVALPGSVLEVDFRTPGGITREELLTIGLPALVFKAANLVGQIKHHVDSFRGVVIPGGKNQKVRTVGHHALIPGDGPNPLTQRMVGNDQHFEGLKAARGWSKPCCFDNPGDGIFGDLL